jgi:hypothetical protein
MNDLDKFLDQFYGKYAPNNIPEGERRERLKQKLSEDFEGFTLQMYGKYAPDNSPNQDRLASLRSKYFQESSGILEQAVGTLKEDVTKTLPTNLFAATGALLQTLDSFRSEKTNQKEIEETATLIQNMQQSPDRERLVAEMGDDSYLLDITNREELIEVLKDSREQFSVGQDAIDTAEKLFGVADYNDKVLSLSQVNSPKDAASFFVNNLVKGGRQIGTGILTFGGSIIPETLGDVYIETIEEKAKNDRITKAEAAKSSDVLATTASVGTVVSLIEGFALGKLTAPAKNVITGFAKGFASESITETLQETAQALGIKLGAGENTVDYLKSEEFVTRLVDAALAGGIAGGPSKAIGTAVQNKLKTIENPSEQLAKDITEADENKVDIQSTVDEVATPQNQEIAKEIDTIASDVMNAIENLDTPKETQKAEKISEEPESVVEDVSDTQAFVKKVSEKDISSVKKPKTPKKKKKKVETKKQKPLKEPETKVRVKDSIIDLETGDVKEAPGPKKLDKKQDSKLKKEEEKLAAKKARLQKQLSNISKDIRPGNKKKRAENFINRQDETLFPEEISQAKKIVEEVTKAQLKKREPKVKETKLEKLLKNEDSKVKEAAKILSDVDKSFNELEGEKLIKAVDKFKKEVTEIGQDKSIQAIDIASIEGAKKELITKGNKILKENKPLVSEIRKQSKEKLKEKQKIEDRLIDLESNILKLRRQGKDDTEAVNIYQEFRKENTKSGELSEEQLNKKLSREVVEKQAVKKSTKEFNERSKRLIPKKEFEATMKEEPSDEDLKRIEKEFEQGLLKDLGTDFEDDVTTSYSIDPNKINAREGLNYESIQKVDKTQYVNLLKRNRDDEVSGILDEIITKVQDLREKSKLPPIDFYVAKGKDAAAGIHITDGVNTAIIINEEGAQKILNTPIHEMVHEYFATIAQIGYYNGLDKNFENSVKEVYGTSVELGNVTLTNIKQKEQSGQRLSWEESKFKRAVEFVTGTSIDNLEDVRQFYGFTSDTEFVAEAFSNLDFIYLLDTIPSTKKGTKSPSLLRKLYKALTRFLKSVFPNTYPEYKSQLGDLVDVMSDFENEYLNSDYLLRNRKGVEFSIQQQKAGKKSDIRNKIVDTVVNAIELNEELQTKKQVIEYVNKINQNLKEENKLTAKEINSVWRRFLNRRKTFAQINELKQDVRSRLNSIEASPLQSSMIEDLLELDPTKLSSIDRNIIKNGLGLVLSTGIYDSKTENIILKNKGREKLERLEKNKGFDFRDMGKRINTLYKALNPAQFVTFMSKHNGQIANELFDIFYSGVMKANANAQLDLQNMVSKGGDSLFGIADRNKLTSKDNIKTYMYATLFTSEEVLDPNSEEFNKNVQDNLEKIEKSLEAKKKARKEKVYTRQSESDIDKEIKIFNELKDQVNSTEDLNTILTEGQKELLDRFKEIIASFEEDTKINTEVVRGKEFTPLYNYIPTYAIGSLGVKELTDPSKDIIALFEEDLENSLNLTTPRSGFTRKRYKKVKDVYYDHDLLSVASKYISSISFDNNIAREVKTLNRVLANKKLAGYIGLRNSRTLKRFIKSNIEAAIRKGGDYANWVKTLENFKNKLVVGRMGTVGQFAVQLLATMPSNAIYAGGGMGKALQALYKFETNDPAIKTLENFMVRYGLGIQVRDVLFEKFENLDDFAKSGINRGISKAAAKAEALTTATLRWSDKQAARITWLSAFFEAGGDLNNPTKEAIVAAERKTMLLQNVSDVTFAPEIFKPKSGIERLAISQFMSFKSFAFNQFLNSLYSIRDAGKSAEARKMLSANILNVLMYQIASQLLVQPSYNFLVEALFGDAEEPEEEQDVMDNIFVRAYYDFLFGGMPTVAEQLLKLLAAKSTDALLPEDNALNTVNVFSPKKVEEIFAEGPYGDLAKTFYESSQVVFDSMKEEGELSEERKQYITLRMWADALLFINVPFRGDISKIFKKSVPYPSKETKDQAAKSPRPKVTPPRPRIRRPISPKTPRLKQAL